MLKIAITFAALVLASTLHAAPQSTGPATEPPPPDYGQPDVNQSAKYSDEVIEQFASAYSRIFEIQRDLSSELEGVEGRERAIELQREAQEKMLEVVEARGLTVEEYNQVVAAMQADVVLRNRIIDEVEG